MENQEHKMMVLDMDPVILYATGGFLLEFGEDGEMKHLLELTPEGMEYATVPVRNSRGSSLHRICNFKFLRLGTRGVNPISSN